MRFEMTRRKFVVASVGMGTSLCLTGASSRVCRAPRPGTLYGRAGEGGIAPGGIGQAVTMDGVRLMVSHPGRNPVRPGKSLLMSPDENGNWTVLYAEV